MNTELDTAFLIETASSVVADVGTPEFSDALLRAIVQIVPHNSMLIIGAERGGGPVLLCDRLDEAERPAFYDIYMKGAYLLAPGYRAAQDTDISGVWSLKDVFPGDIANSDYFKVYWRETGMIDELFMFTRLDNDRAIWLALGRYNENIPYGDLSVPFSDVDIGRLNLVEPIFREAARKNWSGRAFENQDTLQSLPDHDRNRQIMDTFGKDELSPREFEVCQRLLRGHSSKSAARELGISPETERIHRRRIFNKLDVSSHVELMALFVGGLSSK
ncbi:MAG: helix-turn-helix transcriptional regulator [Rhodospirillales bacterium]|jgi:DNA-binding CsgD family transcriptional regulator|nr:helix-turn-helix transcriptional regulator [Rhodospirillales bacterium]